MHKIRSLIKEIDKTHKRLGQMIATNLVAAKAKKCILNISPSGCGKSSATDMTFMILKDMSIKYTSLTLAGLMRIRDQLTNYSGAIIIDDLGAEKSMWSRISTITVLATLVHTHNVHKITQAGELQLTNFYGSASLNIQPVMMNSIVQGEDWIAVIRDKVLRYYHLVRPTNPKNFIPDVSMEWGEPLDRVEQPSMKGRLWYQLVAIGLTQWSFARVKEHMPAMLRACAALDNRTKVSTADYRLLIKLLKPMQTERYLLSSYGFEYGRSFLNNVYCILVEIVSHRDPTLGTIAEDYKVSPSTVERIIATMPDWCWIKANSPKRVLPTDETKKILKTIGAYQKW